MTVRSLFPTQVYTASLQARRDAVLNTRLQQECRQLAVDDVAGQRWSKRNYPGGYTSYGTAARMHTISPTFARLEALVNSHVKRFTRMLALDLRDRPLVMTDCWVNIMPPGVVHGLHLHPLSTISGTYYVATPSGAPGLKVEDPRLSRLMASPPRTARARRTQGPWIELPAKTGALILFESWLRHEVPMNQTRSTRISISFNYGWF
jgi:uncharacterized protein (TIGR02466 family)